MTQAGDGQRPVREALRYLEWASRTPDAVAIETAVTQVSYSSLNAATDRVAELVSATVPPQTVVIVYGRPSAGLVVAALGVLTAGRTLLFADPGHPAARIRTAVDAASCALVLKVGDAVGAEQLGVGNIVSVGLDGGVASTRFPGGIEPAGGRPLPQDAAYLTLTSGTSGRPKCVITGHDGLDHFLAWERDELAVRPGDRIPLITAVTFDVVMRDILLPLSAGATLVIPDAGELTAGTPLDWLEQKNISVAHLVPTVTRMWLRQHTGTLLGLRAALFAGEPLDSELVRQFRKCAPGARTVNLYGPTETTLAKFYQDVDGMGPGIEAVGSPLPGVTARLDSSEGVESVPGEAGEVVLTTPYRNFGYLDAAQAGSGTFDPAGRSYRTGDLGRYTPDGRLQIIGRVDDQLKIRGVRIDPYEVEAELAAHPRVEQAAAVARADESGSHRLIAYFVATRPLSAGALRSWLLDVLPADRIPASFVQLSDLPLSPHGKVNRAALRALELPASSRDEETRTPTEDLVCRIWRKVLAVDVITRDDDFFALGGHSLLAQQVAASIRDETGAELTLKEFFEASDFPALAERVDANRTTADAEIPPAGDLPEEPIGLSDAQLQMWLATQLAGPASGAFALVRACRGPADVQLDHVRQAVNLTVARHEILRTTYGSSDRHAALEQLVHRFAEVPVSELWARDHSELDALLQNEAAEPFDLVAGPVLRVTVIRVGRDAEPRESVVALTVHHIAADEWSMDLLIDEIVDGCDAARNGHTSVRPVPAYQYRQYVCWERDALTTTTQSKSGQSALPDLEDAPTTMALPCDRTRLPTPSHDGSVVGFHVCADTARCLRAVAAAENTSAFTVYLAALQAALGGYAGSADVVIGTPVANRMFREWEQAAGLFVNTVPVRADLRGNPAMDAVVKIVRSAVLDAFDRQTVPSGRTVDTMGARTKLDHNSLVQVMLHVRRPRSGGLPPLWAEHRGPSPRTTRFDLQLLIDEESDGGLDCRLLYATELFDRGTAEALAGMVRRALHTIVEEPQRRLTELATPEEATVEGSRVPLPADDLVSLIERQAATNPERTAVRHGDCSTTYRELDDHANRLAQRLIEHGVGRGSVVAVAMERSAELVTVLLAVLKTGGAYLPLDPRLPDHRIRFLIEDTRTAVVVTDESRCPLPECTSTGPLTVIRAGEPWGHRPLSRTGHELSRNDLAYVLYTSGSTGKPKGVMVEHGSVVNYLSWALSAYPSLADSALLHSPVPFDLTVTALYGPLISGGRVEIGDLPTSTTGVRHWARAGTSVGFLKGTPSHLPILTVLNADGCPGGDLVLGGEPLQGEHVAAWRAMHPDVTVVNEYGPTETTVGCSAYRIAPDDPVPSGILTIGTPIDNCFFYVLDDNQNPVPRGATGELCIGGEVVARGYLGRPDLTAAAFLPDPYTKTSGGRMYRSGDLVRFRGDGALEFRGRRDNQVKIRGYRIEPGEVEAVLLTYPAVHEAAVTAEQDNSRLVCYVVCSPELAGPDELRRHAQRTLPDYLVPERVVQVPSIPRTANGKIDIAALAVDEAVASGTEPTLQGDSELLVARIWSDLMGIVLPGRGDDFFDVGGNSLLAAHVVGRLRKETGTDVPLRMIFENPTVAELASALDTAGDTALRAASPEPPVLRRVPRTNLADGLER